MRLWPFKSQTLFGRWKRRRPVAEPPGYGGFLRKRRRHRVYPSGDFILLARESGLAGGSVWYRTWKCSACGREFPEYRPRFQFTTFEDTLPKNCPGGCEVIPAPVRSREVVPGRIIPVRLTTCEP